MFLLYRNLGDRRLGLHPIAPHPRKAWEFEFIISGNCSLLLRKNDKTIEKRLQGPVLCLTGPNCVHGWGGKPTDACKVIVFHFDEVPFAIRSAIPSDSHKLIHFSPNKIKFLKNLYDRCTEARKKIGTTPPEAKKQAGVFQPLVYNIIGTELSLFALKHFLQEDLKPTANIHQIKVDEALSWYEANLAHTPSVQDVARAIHISATHLRRLFVKILNQSPQHAFTDIQFNRVIWLLRDLSLSIDQVAENSGFGSGSAFSRAFKSRYGTPPGSYRQKLVSSKK
ncbi:MAG: AraC family transcriptional regulator [Verrucomicrobiota bacterium]